MTPLAPGLDLCFFRVISGTEIKNNDHEHVILHLQSLTKSYDSLIREFINPEFAKDLGHFDRVLKTCCMMIEIIRNNPRISLDKTLFQLQETHVFSTTNDVKVQCHMKSMVFSMILWVSHIAVPLPCSSLSSFKIQSQGAKYPNLSSVAMDRSQRPLDVMLRGFGESLPWRKHGREQGAIPFGGEAKRFQVASLNADALRQVAKMQFVWVDSLSAHLDLDPNVPALYLFKAPTFCKLQSTGDSFLSLFATTLCTEDENSAQEFSVPRLMEEIILSYSLLFKDDRRARVLYRKSERQRAVVIDSRGFPHYDPCLEEACGGSLSTALLTWNQPVRETYHADSDFPNLSDRLERLQIFMDGIQTNRIVSLWRDRRDRRLWFTFWVVIIFGVIGIIQGFLGNILAAVQIYFSQLEGR
ncbi:hypothetical protein EKO27_g7188 [Xylaria grammica]|uniref:Uncharacterized protein n=1 Tax=Xylaria grammica TaxID=363999 RepID=A0A439D0Z7_9PEZI|nr:hypothetical protein EKO27_g7188 [Xylaria grammica]